MTLPLAASAVFEGTGDELSQLQDAIILQLESLHVRQGGYVAAILPYAGELDSLESFDKFCMELQGRTPSILVRLGQGDYESGNVGRRRKHELKQQVQVLLCSNHLRSMPTRVEGDELSVTDATKDKGIARMVQDVRQALLGKRLRFEGFQRATPRQHTPLGKHERGLTVFSFNWEFRVVLVDEHETGHENLAATAAPHRHREAETPTVIVAEGTAENE